MLLVAPGSAGASPSALSDHAAVSRDLSGTVEQVKRRSAKTGRHAYRHKYKRRYDQRRYDWTARPYWRPFQYRYWKFYYPYGGPLF
jgi:hypothetical protein